MKRTFFLLLSIFGIFLFSGAQKPEDLLNEWGRRAPIEKVYLHFDREQYIAGETAWFKAYLYSNYGADTISSNLYVELTNENDTIIRRVVLPVFFGGTSGQFDLPDSLPTGRYYLRAYSPSMLARDSAFIGRQDIFISGKKNNSAITNDPSTRLQFFPEGGNFVSAVSNTLAFKATDAEGIPRHISGRIIDSHNETIVRFETYHDGMGYFEMTPAEGEKYLALIDNDPDNKKYELPAVSSKGIAVALIPHPDGSLFEIKQKKDDPVFRVAYMIGQMQHQVVFKIALKDDKDEFRGVINTKNLYSGILQITFFNAADQPLAERLVFVDNKEYLLNAELTTDTLNFSARAKNRFSVQLKDTVQGTFSISVTDAAYDEDERKNNIVSHLLLTSDLKGYIHNPAYYFVADEDSVKTAVDLVMMTNGWRRFKWTGLSQQLSSINKNKNPAFITLSGKVTMQGIKKPFAEKQLILMITAPNKKRSVQFIQTNAEGRYYIDSLIFFDRNRLLFCDVRGKKSQYIDVYQDADTLRRRFAVPANPAVRRVLGTMPAGWQMDYDAILKSNGLLLEGVTVKAQRKTPMQEVDDRYTTGLFGGDATRAVDLVNSDEANPYRNIFDYLQSRIPGLQVYQDGFDYSLYYRQVANASSMGNIPMILYLDEIPTDASYIASIPASQVALVKVFSSFAGADGNAPGGVMAIYTKKGTDYVNTSGFANHTVYDGYSVVKEFYAPDYSQNKSENKVDNRVTLDWRPNVLINSIDPKISFSFYNNDRTKSFHVLIEGMTKDGKFLHIEKIVGARAF